MNTVRFLKIAMGVCGAIAIISFFKACRFEKKISKENDEIMKLLEENVAINKERTEKHDQDMADMLRMHYNALEWQDEGFEHE